jgi:hypothetical protein
MFCWVISRKSYIHLLRNPWIVKSCKNYFEQHSNIPIRVYSWNATQSFYVRISGKNNNIVDKIITEWKLFVSVGIIVMFIVLKELCVSCVLLGNFGYSTLWAWWMTFLLIWNHSFLLYAPISQFFNSNLLSFEGREENNVVFFF